MLGKRILFLRKQQNLSQGELARGLGVTAAALGSYEQGRRTPEAAILVRLSEALGVSADFLLTGTPLTRADLTAAARYALTEQACGDPEDALILKLLTRLTGI